MNTATRTLQPPWTDTIGPVYPLGDVADLFNVDPYNLPAPADRPLIILDCADGTQVVPAFQFDDQSRPVEGILTAYRAVVPHDATDGWTTISWMRWEHPTLNGLSIIDWLRAGRDPQPVQHLAAATSARWKQ